MTEDLGRHRCHAVDLQKITMTEDLGEHRCHAVDLQEITMTEDLGRTGAMQWTSRNSRLGNMKLDKPSNHVETSSHNKQAGGKQFVTFTEWLPLERAPSLNLHKSSS
jgi:hypothetical protein